MWEGKAQRKLARLNSRKGQGREYGTRTKYTYCTNLGELTTAPDIITCFDEMFEIAGIEWYVGCGPL